MVHDNVSDITNNWALLSTCNGMFLIGIEICEK